jgi:hypothetical protein
LLEEWGYEGDEILLWAYRRDEAVAGAVASDLEDIGVRLKLTLLDAGFRFEEQLLPRAAAGLPSVVLRTVRKPTVPNLVGSLVDNARDKYPELSLEEAGSEPSDERRGTILRQDPPPGEPLPSDREFWIVRVWLAEERPVVPDLAGGLLDDARAAHPELSFEVAGREPSDAPPGTILRLDPPSGEALPSDREFRVWLAEGPIAPNQAPSLWFRAILGTPILLFSAYAAWWFFGRPRGQPPRPEVSVEGVKDHGQQSMNEGAGLKAPDFTFRIQIDAGQQSVSAGG